MQTFTWVLILSVVRECIIGNPRIAEHYRLNLTVVNGVVDPTFSFMTVDWDGQIRMDPSSPYAMERLVELKDRLTSPLLVIQIMIGMASSHQA